MPGAHRAGSRRARIGLLGGTFDPVHVGHLALAAAAREHLALDEVRFLPTGRSWQKAPAGADAQQRIDMVRLAIAGTPGLRVDEREARRDGNTYTIDTLAELRSELGEAPAIVLLLGSDQLRNLPTWHRWRELLAHAHLGVVPRAGDTLDGLEPPVRALVDERRSDVLPDAPAGSIVFFPMPPQPVSGSELRARLARGERPAGLLPARVLDYIDRNGLYRAAPAPRRAAASVASRQATRRNRMDPRKLQRIVVDALDDIKAQNVRVYNTTAQTELFDRVIIATGASNRQTRALAAHVRDKVKEAGGHVLSMEGADTGEWVLVDLGDIVVHVMQPPIREYYNLEEIWGAKPVRLRGGEATPTGRTKRAESAGAAGASTAERASGAKPAPAVKGAKRSPAAKGAKAAKTAPGAPGDRRAPAAQRAPTTQRAPNAKSASTPAAAPPARRTAPARRSAAAKGSAPRRASKP